MAARAGRIAGVGRVLAVLGRRNAKVAHRRSASPAFVARVPRECSAWRMCDTSKRPKPEREMRPVRLYRRFGE